MNHPLISIIIPAYQAEREIASCLTSIFRQTLQDFEVILVNDGSTDGTLAAAEPFRNRITIINQENRGRNPARNRGAAGAHGRFLLFCDVDIILDPRFLEHLHAALGLHPDASFAYSSFRFDWKLFRCGPFSADRLRSRNYIHTTSLIRAEHFPGFDEAIRRFMDWDLWLTMLEAGHTGVWVPDVLFQIKTRHEGLSQWMPRFMHRIPWNRLGIRIPALERYRDAERVIRAKHHLPPG